MRRFFILVLAVIVTYRVGSGQDGGQRRPQVRAVRPLPPLKIGVAQRPQCFTGGNAGAQVGLGVSHTGGQFSPQARLQRRGDSHFRQGGTAARQRQVGLGQVGNKLFLIPVHCRRQQSAFFPTAGRQRRQRVTHFQPGQFFGQRGSDFSAAPGHGQPIRFRLPGQNAAGKIFLNQLVEIGDFLLGRVFVQDVQLTTGRKYVWSHFRRLQVSQCFLFWQAHLAAFFAFPAGLHLVGQMFQLRQQGAAVRQVTRIILVPPVLNNLIAVVLG